MVSAAAIRLQVEARLGSRITAPFAPKANRTPEPFPTGIPAADALLGGGIPRGQLTEITGESSTGKTGLAFAIVSGATKRGAACAWIDVQDALDPPSAAAYGIEMERLLWLRAGSGAVREAFPQESIRKEGASRRTSSVPTGSGHPREGNRGMDHALSLFFRGENNFNKTSPSVRNAADAPSDGRSFKPRYAEPHPNRRNREQAANDRLPTRRGEVVSSRQTIQRLNDFTRTQSAGRARADAAGVRLGQGLRATDLLLQAGGFSVVVLDIGDLKAQELVRIPLSTWYKFRLAAEQAQTALILLADTTCAKSCTSLHLYCERQATAPRWSREQETALFEGQSYRFVVERQRGESTFDPNRRKLVANEQVPWSTHALWAR